MSSYQYGLNQHLHATFKEDVCGTDDRVCCSTRWYQTAVTIRIVCTLNNGEAALLAYPQSLVSISFQLVSKYFESLPSFRTWRQFRPDEVLRTGFQVQHLKFFTMTLVHLPLKKIGETGKDSVRSNRSL